MILQRNAEVPVWGTGTDGAAVTVECRGARSEAVVIAGKWKALLCPMETGEPCELIVRSDGREIRLTDVLFGEVWLAGGQSNMEWSLIDSAEGAEEIPAARYPEIRYYNVPKVEWDDGAEHRGEWKICTPDNAPVFSAVAYHFAKSIHHELSIPVGIIGCNWGGTSASCWMREEELKEDEDLRVYIDEFQEQLRDFTWDKFETDKMRYQETVDEYIRLKEQGASPEELGNYPWPPPLSPHNFGRPSGLYHTMLKKASPFAIKGFIYYQGESDAGKALLYEKLLSKLISNWRDIWDNVELPFLFVQLPVYGCDGNPSGEEWPLLRESQQLVSDHVSNTAMAVALDCGVEDDIHPRHKKEVGQRLALLALDHVYGLHIQSSGPVFKEMVIQAPTVFLSFNNLELEQEDETVRESIAGFEVAGDDGRFVLAHAELNEGKIKVWSDQVAVPRHVRYGWANFTDANLKNKYGLPAAPFRTDMSSRRDIQ